MDKHDLVRYFTEELEKAFPLKLDATEGEEDTHRDELRSKAWAFYSAVDDPSQWKLEEIIDAVTLERKWHWRQKS